MLAGILLRPDVVPLATVPATPDSVSAATLAAEHYWYKVWGSTIVVVVFLDDFMDSDAFMVVVTLVPVALASWRPGISRDQPAIRWFSEGSGAVLAPSTSGCVAVSRASLATATASLVAPIPPQSPLPDWWIAVGDIVSPVLAGHLMRHCAARSSPSESPVTLIIPHIPPLHQFSSRVIAAD